MKLGQFYLEVRDMLLELEVQSAKSLRILAYNLRNQELISYETFTYLETITPPYFTKKILRGFLDGTHIIYSDNSEYMLNGKQLANNLTNLLLIDSFIQCALTQINEEELVEYLNNFQAEDWIEKIPFDKHEKIYMIRVETEFFVSVQQNNSKYDVYCCTMKNLEEGNVVQHENLLDEGVERFLYSDGENVFWKKNRNNYVQYIIKKRIQNPYVGKLLGVNKYGLFLEDEKGDVLCEKSDEKESIMILNQHILGAKYIIMKDCLLVFPQRNAINVFVPHFIDFEGKRTDCGHSLKYAYFIQQFLYMEELDFLLDVEKKTERKNLLLSFLFSQEINDTDDVITLADQLLTAGFIEGMQAVSIIEAMHLFKDKKIDVNLDFLFELAKCQHLCSQNPGTPFMCPSFCSILKFLSKKPFFKQKMKNPTKELEGFVFWNATKCKMARQMEIEKGFVDYSEIDGYTRKITIKSE